MSELDSLKVHVDKIKAAANPQELVCIDAFEQCIAQYSAVVVATSVPVLRILLSDKKNRYVGYYALVHSGQRAVAEHHHAQDRQVADSYVHGSYYENIINGALSLDNTGAWGYGICHVRLTVNSIDLRVSFTMHNAYDYQRWFEEKPGPRDSKRWQEKPGYRSNWAHRALLCVRKHFAELKPGLDRSGFATILLRSDGSRETEEFVEAHIWDPLVANAFEHITVPRPATFKRYAKRALKDEEALDMDVLKTLVTEAGIALSEI